MQKCPSRDRQHATCLRGAHELCVVLSTRVLPSRCGPGAQEGDDASRDSGERDERRLAELGRAAVQTYVVAHIFLEKLAAAHGEVEALARQQALIEEEERGEAEAETRCGSGRTG